VTCAQRGPAPRVDLVPDLAVSHVGRLSPLARAPPCLGEVFGSGQGPLRTYSTTTARVNGIIYAKLGPARGAPHVGPSATDIHRESGQPTLRNPPDDED
jgi:hypothetical protein